uniref:Uncharacterized protein n=1 Tax=Tetraselmis sp. GSL018 TaxID=582737 RepID=A0A061SF58_9CHLO
MVSDISAAVESQLSRAKEAASTMELLREQAREARQRASSSEERSSKAMAEIQRLRRALQAKNERINHLESELASDAMAGFGDVAAQLGNVREELDVVRAEADHLAKANSELRAELEEARDRQQAAEAERCDAIQRLEHSEEERRELLEFQSMAADAIREKEVRALERRIRELESPREPAPQAPTLGQASTQASHTRARIEAAVEWQRTPPTRSPVHGTRGLRRVPAAPGAKPGVVVGRLPPWRARRHRAPARRATTRGGMTAQGSWLRAAVR